MLPPLDPATGALPAGMHEATWDEVVARSGSTPKRQALLVGMRTALRALAHAGCMRVYLAGSFVTAKAEPGDWDGCWEEAGVRVVRLPKEIAQGNRLMMEAHYGGELYRAHDITITGENFVIFFQHNRAMQSVGIVALNPSRVP